MFAAALEQLPRRACPRVAVRLEGGGRRDQVYAKSGEESRHCGRGGEARERRRKTARVDEQAGHDCKRDGATSVTPGRDRELKTGPRWSGPGSGLAPRGAGRLHVHVRAGLQTKPRGSRPA
jgi:hypothetical protein